MYKLVAYEQECSLWASSKL